MRESQSNNSFKLYSWSIDNTKKFTKPPDLTEELSTVLIHALMLEVHPLQTGHNQKSP